MPTHWTRRIAANALPFAAFLPLLAPAQAQTYPVKPIQLVVPFAPGGAADVLARLLGQRLTGGLGQTIVVENRPGAGGTIAAAAVAKAPPDGYSLLFVTAGHAGAAALYPTLSFDPVKDFAPVVGIATAPIAVAVNANSKHKTLKEFIADARARPGKLNCAGGGGGATVTNLALEVFKADLKIDIASIPYKGSGPALTALLAGEIDCDFDTLASVASQIKGGKLRALAVTTRQRSEDLPEVPTIAESAIPGFEAAVWYGILAPKGSPAPAIDRLNREFTAALKDPQITSKMKELGADPLGSSPAEFGKFIASEASRWGGVIRKLGLKAD